MSETSLNIILSTTPPVLNYVNFFFIVFNTLFLLLILILILNLGGLLGRHWKMFRKYGKTNSHSWSSILPHFNS